MLRLWRGGFARAAGHGARYQEARDWDVRESGGAWRVRTDLASSQCSSMWNCFTL